MLGRLLSSASSAASSPSGTRPSTSVGLEGEDQYTRTLLYPDSSLFSHNHSLSSSGYISNSGSSVDGEHIDIDGARDIRVIIAQDGTGSEGKSIMYDSKPTAIVTSNYGSPNIPNPFSNFDDPPLSPGLCGGFSRRRRSPTPYSQSLSHLSCTRDEWVVITDCMFGSVSLAYKGPSTKLHILPGRSQEDRSGTSTPISEGRPRGRFYQSPQTQSGSCSSYSSNATNTKDRRSVLITRLFSVVIPPTPVVPIPCPPQNQIPTPASSVGSTNGFPFPRMAPTPTPSTPKPIKPTKTSMYAIGLVISLPQSSSANSFKRCPNCWALQYDFDSRRPSTGYFCCEIAAASIDDEFRTDTVHVEGGHDSGIADDQMDFITKHWDIITRALRDLQATTQSKIVDNLQNIGIMSPGPSQSQYKYRRRVELRPGALMYDEGLKLEIERFKWRIVSGIKIPRVVTGQGRWSLWRDEARWLNKRFGGKEQNL